MRNLKESPAKQLERFSSIFIQLGLVLALFALYVTLEYKTENLNLIKNISTKIPEVVYTDLITEVIFKKEQKVTKSEKLPSTNAFMLDGPVKKIEEKQE
jgi:protein TonB